MTNGEPLSANRVAPATVSSPITAPTVTPPPSSRLSLPLQLSEGSGDSNPFLPLIENMEALRADVAQLQVVVKGQNEQLVRLNAAMCYLPCPNSKEIVDDTLKDGVRVANIEECVMSNGCGCESGVALKSGTWVPTEEDQS